MKEKRTISGTITRINNKISAKGVSFSIYSIVTLEGKEMDLFKFENNLKLLNRLCKFEVESNMKDNKEYNTIIDVQEVKKE